MTKFVPFDNEVMLALLGFSISPDNNYAVIRRGDGLDDDDVAVSIMQLPGWEQFCVWSRLPKGCELMCFTTREHILRAVQRAAVEWDNEAAILATSKPHGIG